MFLFAYDIITAPLSNFLIGGYERICSLFNSLINLIRFFLSSKQYHFLEVVVTYHCSRIVYTFNLIWLLDFALISYHIICYLHEQCFSLCEKMICLVRA